MQEGQFFKDFNLHPNILKALEEAGFTTPTPIQTRAIPEVLKGSDLRASAQTGTGKTAAFILPTLHRLTLPSPLPGKGPRAVILVPTRELAIQVAAEAVKWSSHLQRCKVVCIYGGAPYPPQYRDLSRHHEILVATPGRLIDHMERGKVNLQRVEIFILDEADRMLDMGFIGPVEQIANQLPKQHQTLLFSATMPNEILKLSMRLLTDPVEIQIAAEKINHEKIDQRLHKVDNLEHKYRILNHLLDDPEMMQTIIFTATKRQADHIVGKLSEGGRSAQALHGGMNQRQRTKTIHAMRKEQFDILVATDVAARGIDIQTISHVINFDLPRNIEDYVHRIGRTARAGASGTALSFASHREMGLVKQIEKFIGCKIEAHLIPGMEPKPEGSRADGPRANGSRGNGNRFQDKNKKNHKGRPNNYKAKPRKWYP